MSIQRTGFHPLRHTGGRHYAGGENRYYIPASDSTALYLGDPVKLANAADASGVPAITKASPGDAVIGFIRSFERDHTNIDAVYRLASTARYALVVDDPSVIVSAIDAAGTLALTDCGKFINFAAGTGNATTGISGAYLDASTLSTTGAGFRLVSLLRQPDAATGVGAVWECAVMLHQNAPQHANAAAGSGTVTSVGLSMPTGFSVASSPVTSSGTIAVTTSLSGVLKGTGSAITAATAGTDYASPYVPVTTTYTASGAIATADRLAIVNSASQCDMTLGSGSTNGQLISIKRYGSGTVTVTLNLDGSAGAVITADSSTIKEVVHLAWNSTNSTWLAV